MAETAAELNMLQLEFVSQVLDDCARLLGAYFEVNKEEGEVLCPVATQKAPVWVSRAGELQKSEQAMRERVAVPRSPDRLRSLSRRSLLPKCPVFGVPLEMLPLVPGFHVPLILFDTTEALLNNQERLLQHPDRHRHFALSQAHRVCVCMENQTWRPRDSSASLPQRPSSRQSKQPSTTARSWALGPTTRPKSLAH